MTREEFNLIGIYHEGAHKSTALRQIDLYDIFCALLYAMKNGCTWRDLSGNFSKWH
ncbi:hypothetical protein EFO98_07950 [Lactiplantibacillus argentoratensis]|nr:hypothetical protein [Lentilactobacillus buchneri]MCT4443679.1 hypothetical protein [Lactiplantibacillus argentoratensis]PUD95578.1 hypothetical protein DA477_12045 [Levilactobacillus brevis]